MNKSILTCLRLEAIAVLLVLFVWIHPNADAQTNTFPASGYTGIGTTSPSFALTIVGTDWNSGQIRLATYAGSPATPSTNYNSQLRFEKYRGTPANPTKVEEPDRIGAMLAVGGDGSTFQRSGVLGFRVDDATMPGKIPMAYFVETGTTSNNRAERMLVASDGQMQITDLAGMDTRMVVADQDGWLGTQDVPPEGDEDWVISASTISNTTHKVTIGGGARPGKMTINNLDKDPHGLYIYNAKYWPATHSAALYTNAVDNHNVNTYGIYNHVEKLPSQASKLFGVYNIFSGSGSSWSPIYGVNNYFTSWVQQGFGKIYGYYVDFETPPDSQEYSFYAASGNAFFADKVGIGTQVPTASLMVDGNGTDDIVHFRNGSSNSLYINSLGQVAINTLNPATNYELSVDGRIACEELLIDDAAYWPDYVFEDDYPLISIEELEQIVRKQKHLPRIPSASEIETNGIEVGVMTKMLIEKIEELTLYTIQQQHLIRQMQKEIGLLKTK